MANHNLPTLTSTYTNFVSELDGRLDDLAVGMDPAVTTVTNPPTNSIRWNSADKKWEKWSGTAWNELSANYAINLQGPSTVSANSSGDAFRITQTGSGNALVVEDSASTDSTPFVIDGTGTVLVGIASAPSGGHKMLISGSSISSASQRVGDISDGTTSGALVNLSNTSKSVGISADPDNLGAGSRIVFSVDGVEKARISEDGFGIGSTSTAGYSLRVNDASTPVGGTTTRIITSSQGALQSDVTSGFGFHTAMTTAAGSYTITSVSQFYANGISIGAGSAVTNQYGYRVHSGLNTATNNYGFYGEIAAGAGRWNFYAAGTAANYFAGETTINSGLTIGRTAVTSPGASDGNVFSGTYTPTLTNVTNVAASTALECQYMRVGNVVTVSGQLVIDPTATGAIVLRMSLPIASSFTLSRQAGGTFVATASTYNGGAIVADVANDTVALNGNANDATNLNYYFTFTYRVL